MNQHLKVKIDWKSIFENILNIKVSDETIIKVKNFNGVIKNIRWLAVFDDATFLNWFYAHMFFEFRPIFQFYSVVDSWDAYIGNRGRNYQRHEQCLNLIEEYFPQVMPILVKHLLSNETESLIQSTLSRVAKMSENLIKDSQKLSQSEKETALNELSETMKTKFLPILMPADIQPKDSTMEFFENFNENDTLTSFMTKGKAFRDHQLNITDEYGIISNDNIFFFHIQY